MGRVEIQGKTRVTKTMKVLSLQIIIIAIFTVGTTVKGDIDMESDESMKQSYMRGKSFKNSAISASSQSLLDESLVYDNHQNEMISQGRQLQAKQNSPPPPRSLPRSPPSQGDKKTVYVFFQEINEKTEINEKNMIENWKKAWSEIGWTPKLLTIKDAKRIQNIAFLKKVQNKFHSNIQKKL